MLAFQLKIMIKNSKPPIWRRVIVPAGITFSQLSIILNKVMGWCGYHMFEFEFYHRELRIMEDGDEFCMDYDSYDYMEASTTYIREFLEEEGWFTYTYDLGDNWEHRVTVEKVMDDYAFDYPVVVKYKGDCPPEDCGGIWGYYEYLEIMQDKSHPEYEDRAAWLEMQGYPDEYDMAWVNDELRRDYCYRWGKGENRIQREIYRDLFEGKAGLQATKNDSNADKELHRSKRHQVDDMLRQTAELLKIAMKQKSEQSWQKQTTLEEILGCFDKKSLLEIAKDKGLKKVLGYTKERLIERLVEYMLDPEVMRSYFLCLQDREINMFEAVAQGKCEQEGLQKELLDLYGTDYVGLREDGRMVVPDDVYQRYCAFCDDKFRAQRQEISFVMACLRTAVLFYGVAPLEKILQMVNQHPKLELSMEKLLEDMAKIPGEMADWTMVGNKLYYSSFYPDDRGLLSAQGDKPYYMPTEDEIWDMGMYGFLPDHPASVKFAKYLAGAFDIGREKADMIAEIVQQIIRSDCEMADIFNVLEDFGVVATSQHELKAMTGQINELWNNTRMLVNRGFTPNELVKQQRKLFVVPPKVYPNDPCPCGSGKKYKKCCGR